MHNLNQHTHQWSEKRAKWKNSNPQNERNNPQNERNNPQTSAISKCARLEISIMTARMAGASKILAMNL